LKASKNITKTKLTHENTKRSKLGAHNSTKWNTKYSLYNKL